MSCIAPRIPSWNVRLCGAESSSLVSDERRRERCGVASAVSGVLAAGPELDDGSGAAGGVRVPSCNVSIVSSAESNRPVAAAALVAGQQALGYQSRGVEPIAAFAINLGMVAHPTINRTTLAAT